MPRAVRSIQMIIQVMKPTATIESEPPMISCASKLRPYAPKVRTRAERQREHDCEDDTESGEPDHRGAAGLREVRDHHPDDEGCLESFAQADDEVREQGHPRE